MKIDCIIGIDPGANGGIVKWAPNEKLVAIKMPKDLKDIGDYLTYVKSISSPIVFIEKLGVRPDDIMADYTGVNMGKLYRIQKMIANYEHLKAIITVSGVPYVMVHPMKWQNTLHLRKKSRIPESKSDRKHRYQQTAKMLYPELKATLWNSDATLIMHFGRYVLKNDPEWVRQNLPKNLHDGLF